MDAIRKFNSIVPQVGDKLIFGTANDGIMLIITAITTSGFCVNTGFCIRDGEIKNHIGKEIEVESFSEDFLYFAQKNGGGEYSSRENLAGFVFSKTNHNEKFVVTGHVGQEAFEHSVLDCLSPEGV